MKFTQRNHSYLFPVYLSSSYGLGVFTEVFIPRGALVWSKNNNYIQILTKSEYENFPHKKYVMQDVNGEYIVSLDIARYENHSDNPNLRFIGTDRVYALRDIFPDEELLSNYKEYDLLWQEKLRG